jgi:hypothetical protein
MPKKNSGILCPACNPLGGHTIVGGTLQKRIVRNAIQIPKEKEITNVSKAWLYAGQVCLRLHDLMLKFPPSENDDHKISKESHKLFSNFNLLNEEEHRLFESRHSSGIDRSRRNVKRKIRAKKHKSEPRTKSEPEEVEQVINRLPVQDEEPVHIRLPDDSGRVSKSSISLLYNAIVCHVLSELTREIPLQEEISKRWMKGIYSFFNLLNTDTRYRYPQFYWITKILPDIEAHGFHAAAKRNAVTTGLCKYCESIDKRVEMQFIGDSMNMLCPECGGTEDIKWPLTTKHLKNMYNKMKQKANDFSESYIDLESFLDDYGNLINEDHSLKEDFMRRFKRYENEAERGSFGKYQNYFIGHSVRTGNKVIQKKWCPLTMHGLAHVRINDQRYIVYKALICKLAEANKEGDEKQAEEMAVSAGNLLKEMGWSDEYVDDKIEEDLKENLILFMMLSGAKTGHDVLLSQLN